MREIRGPNNNYCWETIVFNYNGVPGDAAESNLKNPAPSLDTLKGERKDDAPSTLCGIKTMKIPNSLNAVLGSVAANCKMFVP